METRSYLLALPVVSGILSLLGFVPMEVFPATSSAPARSANLAMATFGGGATANPPYVAVVASSTGHAEAVEVHYNPGIVSYQQLLHVFFLGSHNPTELNRHGPETDTAVRSIAFYRSPAEQQLINSTIRRIETTHRYSTPIVTQVKPYARFWPAEEYHQSYYHRNPNNSYVSSVSRPQVEQFRRAFPQLSKPAKAL